MSAVQHHVRGLARPQASIQSTRPRGDASRPFAVDDLTGKIQLNILPLPGFDLWDLAISEEIAAIFNLQPHRYRFEVGIQTICDGRVPASCGLEIAANPSRSTAPNLLILGGAAFERNQYSAWRFRLRRAFYEGARVFSDAGGTFALARAGLLDGHVASAPWRSVAAWRTLAPNVQFVTTQWTEGQKFHSCLGGRALVHLLLGCMSHQFGTAVGRDVARGLNIEFSLGQASRSEFWSHLPAHCHAALRDAVRAIHCNLEVPLGIEEIRAAARGVSERTLQRLFRQHLGTTIYAYYRVLRLEHARELLRLTSLSVTEVSLMAWFEDLTHFSQCYRKRFDCPPRRDR